MNPDESFYTRFGSAVAASCFALCQLLPPSLNDIFVSVRVISSET